MSIWHTSNYLGILTPTEACQWVFIWWLLLKPSRKSKCYT